MPRTPPDPDALCDLYVDESSQTKHRYLALGGIVVPTAKAGLLEESLKASRLPELPYGEIAWTKVSKSKLAAYKRHVDTILKPSLDLYPVQFHSIIVDTHKIRDNIWNGGSRENGFNKEIYQLLHKFLRLNKTKLFHVYLDKRESAIPLKELRSILNSGAHKKYPNLDWPFRRLHFRDSSTSNCIQLVDVLLGAVAFHVNGHRHANGASEAKSELSDYILTSSGVRNPLTDTSIAGRFTIWHRKLEEGTSRRPR